MDTRRDILADKFRSAGATGKKAHVISSKGHWVVFKEGSDKIIKSYSTKTAAIRGARKYMVAGNAEALVLHKKDGTVERMDS